MSGKNPFKVIEEENVQKYRNFGPSVPVFLSENNNSSIQLPPSSSGSPSFPSFS